MSIITGMRHADRGTVVMAVPRRLMAVCPDVPEFDGWLSAFEIVDLARSMIAPGRGAGDVLTALRTAGLGDSARRRVGGFSRGMTQRLGLACALVGDPRLLILDEPTSALDPAGRAEVLSLVAQLRGRCTVIFSSHILADVQRVADHVGILRAGRLLYQGPTQELIDTYLRPRWLLRVVGDLRQQFPPSTHNHGPPASSTSAAASSAWTPPAWTPANTASLEHPGFHAHLVLCEAASPGGSAVMRLPDLVPGPAFV